MGGLHHDPGSPKSCYDSCEIYSRPSSRELQSAPEFSRAIQNIAMLIVQLGTVKALASFLDAVGKKCRVDDPEDLFLSIPSIFFRFGNVLTPLQE